MLAALLAGILTAVRDLLIAAALAWVGVSVEQAEHSAEAVERACATDNCTAPTAP
jgi:hypothetical protein